MLYVKVTFPKVRGEEWITFFRYLSREPKDAGLTLANLRVMAKEGNTIARFEVSSKEDFDTFKALRGPVQDLA